MIKSLFRKNPDFIEIYDDALSQKECEILINQFEKSDEQFIGLTSNGYKPEEKKCMQLCVDLNDRSVISTIVKPNLISCIRKYREKYRNQLHQTSAWDLYHEASFQKYDGKEDGYKVWHCEHHPSPECCSKRIMAWMIYLNDAKSGTEFYDRPTIKARRGRCVMWPAFWTHTHRGVPPNIGLKYIITGWISYD